MRVTLPAIPLLVTSSLLVAGPAIATNLYNPVVSSTTVIDGASIELDGTLNDTNGNAQPWVVELYAGAGECVRFFISTTAFDSVLTVISPGGYIYHNDDSDSQGRPLVKINGAPGSGWYTVQVSEFFGQPQNANFALKYGRYNFNNPNCSDPTFPLSEPRDGVAPAKALTP